MAPSNKYIKIISLHLLTRKTIVPISRRDPTISIVGYITDRAIWMGKIKNLFVHGRLLTFCQNFFWCKDGARDLIPANCLTFCNYEFQPKIAILKRIFENHFLYFSKS